eukprot:scpid97421/ scgid4764/ 
MPGIHPRRTGCGENAAKRESATAALSIIVLCLLGATIHCGSAEVTGAWNHLFQNNVDYVFAYNSTALLPESRTSTLAKVKIMSVPINECCAVRYITEHAAAWGSYSLSLGSTLKFESGASEM